MKPISILCLLGVVAAASFAFIARPAATQKTVKSPTERASKTTSIPTSELEKYQPLAMEEIFQMPAGPKGLEYTEKAKSLDGMKVAVTGFMVRHAHADPHVFLFAPEQMVLFQAEFGTADDLPPYALHVITQGPEGKAARYVRDQIRVLGTLQLGPRQEIDGRVSQVRLLLDHVTKPGDAHSLPILASLAMQPERLIAAERVKPATRPAP